MQRKTKLIEVLCFMVTPFFLDPTKPRAGRHLLLPQGGSAIKLILSPKGLWRETKRTGAELLCCPVTGEECVRQKTWGSITQQVCGKSVFTPVRWAFTRQGHLKAHPGSEICFDWKPRGRGELDKWIFGYGGAEGPREMVLNIQMVWWPSAKIDIPSWH